MGDTILGGDMIEKLETYLVGIVLGVRFRANFAIEDQLGKITDTILYPENSFFDPLIFPRVNASIGKKTLFNEITGDMMRIDNSNIILEINLGEKPSFQIDDVDIIASNFNKQIINGIMKEFSIKEIMRIGFVRNYIFNLDKLANTFINKTIGNTLEGINDINLNFSKKIPKIDSLVEHDVNDYDNVIFNIIKRADLEEIFISVDYQSFYDPFLPLSNQIKFQPFFDKAKIFNKKNFLPWLNTNYVEAIDE